MMIQVILFGYFLTCVSGDGVADVVLSCALVEEGVGVGVDGMGGGSQFRRTPATLILRDVPVAPDQSLETLTPFVPPSIPDPDAILLEATGEVMCELSRYSPHGSQDAQEATHFLVSLSVEGGEFSTAFILQTSVSVSAPLRGDVLLYCGFRQQETPLAQEVAVEWRLQHRGKGWKVFEMKTRLDDAEGSTVVLAERQGSSVNASLVVGQGDASLTLSRLKALDEGTYICTTDPPQTLSCYCSKYYPLDAQMEWWSLSPEDSEPKLLLDQGSLSSHRQHGDGSYSLSSHLSVPSSVSLGTRLTCRVSHQALDAPVSLTVVVESPPQGSYWWVLGFLIITVLFFHQVMT
ncbi:hypothetical protein F7725_017957 [Dissostichus mawsoni]|uniref:Ig-like domain-containing protein n=1 Tax=Dissostichus mawsoni TaxID=36200 RepID=A0A7J5XQB8_DISMA|nr:hypothetical protein F7725_017957 [Dissostichus mawsoni]